MTREETIAMVESYISGSLALYVRNVTLNSSGLLLRFERMQQRHYGMKLLASTLMNLRAFCGV
jgi:hypothetical protein